MGYLEREYEERRREIRTLGERIDMAPSTEERIEELEAKVRELEALTRGLTDEMLDLKSVVMKISARSEERRVPPPVKTTSSTGQKNPAAEKAEGKNLELIMQADGTLKPEPRTSERLIIASGRYTPKGTKKAEEKESSPLIYATDDEGATDDAVVIRKKK